jgi:hypothetical protein
MDVECRLCGKSVRKTNLKRHIRQKHEAGLSAAGPVMCRATSLVTPTLACGASAAVVSKATPVATEPFSVPSKTQGVLASLHGELKSEDYLTATIAAQELIERHQSYSMTSLCEFIETRHPSIPRIVRPYLVAGAAAAAQHASRIHQLAELYRDSDDLKHRRTAFLASRSLMSWSFGLRNEHEQPHHSSDDGVEEYVPTRIRKVTSGDEGPECPIGSAGSAACVSTEDATHSPNLLDNIHSPVDLAFSNNDYDLVAAALQLSGVP